MNPEANLSARQLQQAFQVFNETSLQLGESYARLEAEVARLNAELSAARSERLRQLAEKERLANRLQRLLEALPGGVVVLDGAGQVTEANPGARALLGEPLVGEAWQAVTASAFLPDAQELALRDGRRLSLSVRSLGSEPGRIVLLTDISETRALQETVARHNRLSAMGEMAAGLAHQIRTPLAAATLYLSQLANPNLGAARRVGAVGKLRARLVHLERLVNDMLSFARGGASELESVDVSALLVDLEQALEPQLAVTQGCCEIDDRSDGAELRGNREALLGALLNVASNAIEAAGDGVRLEIGVHRGRDGFVEIVFSDNGPGILEAVRERVFEPFFTSRSQGTGLGLAVVRTVVRGHGGEAAVDHAAGGGARVTLRLPLAGQALPSGHGVFNQQTNVRLADVGLLG